MHKDLLAQIIKSKRKEKGLRQVDVSAELDISYRHYQDIEGGKINMRLDTLLKLLNYFDVKLLVTKDHFEEYSL